MKPSNSHSASRAILAGSLVFAGSLDAAALFTEDFEGDSSKWNDGAVWGVYNTSEDFSGSDHSQIPGGGDTYANLIEATGASINGGPATATINLTDLTEKESTALSEGNAFWSFEAWLASYTANEEYTLFTAEWFDGADGAGTSLGTTTFADGSSDLGVVESIEGFDPSSSSTLWTIKNWSRYAQTGSIPAGAASLVLSYAGTGGGNRNDGYADLIKLDLITDLTSIAYAQWAANNGLDGSPGREADFATNPDDDSFSNGLEWILGGNPLTTDDESLLTVAATSADGITLAFNRNEVALTSATLIVEWNTDLLSPWNEIPIGASSSGPDADGSTVVIDEDEAPDYVIVNIPSTNEAEGNIFVRLRATQ